MNRNSTRNRWVFPLLFALLIAAGMIWINYALAVRSKTGREFQILSLSGRSLLQKGQSPYKQEVPPSVQGEFQTNREALSVFDQTFHYPIYIIILTAPLVLLGEGPAAQVAWMLILELALAGGVYLIMKSIGWRKAGAEIWAAGLLFLFSPPAIASFRSGEAAVLSFAALMLAIYLLDRDRPLPAGFFLAVSTITPRIVVLIIPFLLLWAAFQHQGRFILAFLVSLILLGSLPLLAVPDWPLQWIWNTIGLFGAGGKDGSLVLRLAENFQGIFQIAAGAFYGAIGLALLAAWLLVRPKTREDFLWSAFFTGACSVLITCPQDFSNGLLTFPGLILTVFMGMERWGRTGKILTGLGLLILIGSLWLITFTAGSIYPLLWILSAASLVGLWWTRWWFTRPLFREDPAARLG